MAVSPGVAPWTLNPNFHLAIPQWDLYYIQFKFLLAIVTRNLHSVLLGVRAKTKKAAQRPIFTRRPQTPPIRCEFGEKTPLHRRTQL